jgi:hypothetical protein
MILLVVVALVLLSRLALRHEWPGTSVARSWWAAHRGQIFAFVRASPATFVYLAILTITTWVLRGASPQVDNALLADQSTNLHHLAHDPIHVLIRSAFWLGDYRLLFWAVLFLVVLAPAERWLGTSRWIVAFVSGHVGATLITAAGIWVAIRTGAASHRLENVVDVGVSYGFSTVAGLFTYRLPGRWRWTWAAGLVVWAIGGIVIGGGFTSYGHATALVIGFALYPLSRARAVRARMADPLLLPRTTAS